MVYQGYKLIDFVILGYTFALALLMVTPYFAIINVLSVGTCLLAIPVIVTNFHINYNKLFSFYLMQFCWLCICLVFIKYQQSSAEGLFSLFKNTITAVIPAMFITSTKKFINVMWAFVIGGAANVVFNIVNGLASLTSGVRFISEDAALTLNSFAHGTMIYLIAALVLYSFVPDKKIKLLLTTFVFCCILSLMITGSRQSFISLIGLGLAYMGFRLKEMSFNAIRSIILVCVLATIIGYILFIQFPDSPVVRRFTEAGNEGDEDRWSFVLTAWKLFLDSPLFGYGVGSFKYFSDYVYTHSAHTEILFVGGLFYSLLYYWFYIKFFKSINMVSKLERMVLYKDDLRYVLFKSIIICILINGLFYMIQSSRLALTLQFFILNYILSRGYNLRKEQILDDQVEVIV